METNRMNFASRPLRRSSRALRLKAFDRRGRRGRTEDAEDAEDEHRYGAKVKGRRWSVPIFANLTGYFLGENGLGF